MDGRIYSPEKGKFVSLKTKHGQKVLKNYNEHRVGGDKHQNCAYCKIVNPQTGKLVSTYGQTGVRVIRDYVKQEGGEKSTVKLISTTGERKLIWVKKIKTAVFTQTITFFTKRYDFCKTNDTGGWSSARCLPEMMCRLTNLCEQVLRPC